MFILIGFIAVNLIFSIVLEKKEMHAATVAHSVVFVVLLFYILVATPIPLTDSALINLMGEDNLYILREAFTAVIPVYGISSILVIDFVTIVCLTALLLQGVVTIVRLHLSSINSDFFRSLRKRSPKIFLSRDFSLRFRMQKIYRMGCVMLC